MKGRAEWDPVDHKLKDQGATFRKVLRTEFSECFVDLMRSAMIVSFYKYGLLEEAYPRHVDAIESLKKRLEHYEEDGNVEWLVDISNFALIEFMHPRHSKAHFAPQDSDTSPGRVSRRTGKEDQGNNDTIGGRTRSRLADFR